MSIHNGHRERLRQRFRKEGLTNFAPHEVLELLLYYCIPRADTNGIAHRLIQRYKTIGRVLQASEKELQMFEGIGENATFFLSLLNAANRYINVEQATQNCILNNLREYGQYLKPLFDGLNCETVYLLCLDAKGMVLGHHKISDGSSVSTALNVRKIVDIALTSNAASVILAHNHPGGIPFPSKMDRDATLYLANILQSIEVAFVDHIIFSGEDYLSMMQCGALSENSYSGMY